MPGVSVVIPAFNAQPYIAEAIESVLTQTYSDLEIIVIDDGSTDGTLDEIRRFGSDVRLLTQQRGGPSAARNAGVAAAASDWIAFLDADDAWLPDKLRRQFDEAGRNNSSVVTTDRFNVGARGPLPERQSDVQPLHEGDVFEQLLYGNFITTSAVLLRKDVFLRAGGFPMDASIPVAEDWDLWLRIAHDERIAVVRAPLVRYRLHSSGTSRNAERMNNARAQVVRRALRLRRGAALPPATRRRIYGVTWATNGWDAARHGERAQALRWYVKSIAAWPLHKDPYLDMFRVVLGKA